MKNYSCLTISALLLAFFLSLTSSSSAQFDFFKSKKKIEAEAGKEYLLKDSDGYWFILTKKFSGPDARKNANKLVYELRKKYKVQAFLYKYDPDKSDLEELVQRGELKKKYHYLTPRAAEYAVLVGSYPTIDDLNLQENLLVIKRSKPQCLEDLPDTPQIIQAFEARAKSDKEYAGYGPLGGAIVVPNPQIPKEFFAQKGVVDPFIEKINSDSKFSLLNNPKMYTLRVATFTGDSAFQKMGEGNKNLDTKLKEAGIHAAALCEALRKKGIEAWEFHDRDSSFVTIGSFDNYGSIRPDGRTELDPAINKLIEDCRGEFISGADGNGAYRAVTVTVEVNASDKNSFGGLGKKQKLELPLDLQPFIIMVPQRPANAKRTLQAQKKLETELHQYELMRIEEELAVDNQEFDRNYGQNAPGPMTGPNGQPNQANANGPVPSTLTPYNGQGAQPAFNGQAMSNSQPAFNGQALPENSLQLAQRSQENFQQPGPSLINPQANLAGMNPQGAVPQNGSFSAQVPQGQIPGGAVNPNLLRNPPSMPSQPNGVPVQNVYPTSQNQGTPALNGAQPVRSPQVPSSVQPGNRPQNVNGLSNQRQPIQQPPRQQAAPVY